MKIAKNSDDMEDMDKRMNKINKDHKLYELRIKELERNNHWTVEALANPENESSINKIWDRPKQ